MPTSTENFRCMMCGHEFQEVVEKDEDKERACPKCRSNSIRRLKAGAAPSRSKPASGGGA